ncbi:MAG: lysophospholipid acyltransferase family protein [Christensenellales bacterium]|jgi:1-acyl-sn-glycerol-3-phosphate acyltransferase|nr:1-acyl-sn-glycerol-3-phosphate acyltransferase [Clostridiales bacterium]
MNAERQRKPRTWFYQFARLLLTPILALIYPCKLIGRENIDLQEPFILISNHQSMMDPLLLAIKFKRYEIHFIGKRELTSFKPLKWIVNHLHMVAVSRKASDLSAMRAATAVLREGHVLGIFPEGTRMHGVPMASIESGTSLIALRTHVPLLPVYITKRPKPFRWLKMVVAPPIPYEDLVGENVDKGASDELTKRIQRVYADLHEKYNKKTSVE